MEDSIAIAALYRALVRHLYAHPERHADLDAVQRAIVVENKWRAQRYGVHGTFVHLYINGYYWGLYNVVERPDEWFASEHFGHLLSTSGNDDDFVNATNEYDGHDAGRHIEKEGRVPECGSFFTGENHHH